MGELIDRHDPHIYSTIHHDANNVESPVPTTATESTGCTSDFDRVRLRVGVRLGDYERP